MLFRVAYEHFSFGVAMTSTKYLATVVLALATAACGDTWGQRAVTGGAIGAGSGAVIGAVTPVGVLPGALIGGVVGAGVGAATTPRY
jgi:osmotically inducible lipoprotein OsmB